VFPPVALDYVLAMGNISSVGTMLPISFGSTIIGFVSFAFTIATFLRVFWAELSALSDATHEIKVLTYRSPNTPRYL